VAKRRGSAILLPQMRNSMDGKDMKTNYTKMTAFQKLLFIAMVSKLKKGPQDKFYDELERGF